MNKYIIILSSILIGLVLFIGGYFFNHYAALQGKKETFALVNNSLLNRFQETPQPSPTPSDGFYVLPEIDIAFPTAGQSASEILYYHKASGDLRLINTATNETKLIATLQNGLSRLALVANNKRLLATSKDGSGYYDLSDGNHQTYDSNLHAVTISKTGDTIAYLFLDEDGNGSIRISDPELKTTKNLLATRLNNWQIDWLTSTRLALTTSKDYKNTSIYTLDTETRQFQNIIDSQYVLDRQWSPDGQHLLYAQRDHVSGQPQLMLFNVDTNESRPLDINIFANQCTWSIDNHTLTCFQAQDNQRQIITFDSHIRQPTTTTLYQSNKLPSTIEKIFLSSLEDRIFLLSNGQLFVYVMK